MRCRAVIISDKDALIEMALQDIWIFFENLIEQIWQKLSAKSIENKKRQTLSDQFPKTQTLFALLSKSKKSQIKSGKFDIQIPQTVSGELTHTKENKLYLPSKAQLKRKLLDWTKGKEIPR